jgi:hypothetical protein
MRLKLDVVFNSGLPMGRRLGKLCSRRFLTRLKLDSADTCELCATPQLCSAPILMRSPVLGPRKDTEMLFQSHCPVATPHGPTMATGRLANCNWPAKKAQ